MRFKARTADWSSDGTPLDCSTSIWLGCPSRVMSNTRYTRRASPMRGSISYFSQLSETFRRTVSTYHPKRVPKSPPPPVKPNPPFARAGLMLGLLLCILFRDRDRLRFSHFRLGL